MTSVFYAIGDIVKAMLPAFKALGHPANIFFSLATAVLVFYWIYTLVLLLLIRLENYALDIQAIVYR
jgi:hypothetical protein